MNRERAVQRVYVLKVRVGDAVRSAFMTLYGYGARQTINRSFGRFLMARTTLLIDIVFDSQDATCRLTETCPTEGVNADGSRKCGKIGDNGPHPRLVGVTRNSDEGGVQWQWCCDTVMGTGGS